MPSLKRLKAFLDGETASSTSDNGIIYDVQLFDRVTQTTNDNTFKVGIFDDNLSNWDRETSTLIMPGQGFSEQVDARVK